MDRPTTAAGRAALDALIAEPQRALLVFDYDGTLAPIVTDPADAVPQPGVVTALEELSRRVGAVAILTGRPVPQLLALAGLDGWVGGPLIVVGHYGLQRWTAADGRIVSAETAPGLAAVRAELPDLLARLELGAVDIEDKGHSVAVHVRRLQDPDAALSTLEGPLTDLAERNALTTQPGRRVIEIRPAGVDKGVSLRRLVEDTAPDVVAFIGDDVGDLPAFEEVERLRNGGPAGLLVCSESAEVSVLRDRADLVLAGPPAVKQFVADLASRLEGGSC